MIPTGNKYPGIWSTLSFAIITLKNAQIDCELHRDKQNKFLQVVWWSAVAGTEECLLSSHRGGGSQCVRELGHSKSEMYICFTLSSQNEISQVNGLISLCTRLCDYTKLNLVSQIISLSYQFFFFLDKLIWNIYNI